MPVAAPADARVPDHLRGGSGFGREGREQPLVVQRDRGEKGEGGMLVVFVGQTWRDFEGS